MEEGTKECYDVCIIGAGPSGLACLSAICEPYSVENLRQQEVERALDSIGLRKKLRVCVIDPSAKWLSNWNENFETLRIQHLRSPAMGHPDMFDDNSLLAYACRHGRYNDDLFDSGCCDRKDLLGLGQTQVGLWKLPSTRLFNDFCDELVCRLPHTLLHGKVVDIDETSDGGYKITWCDQNTLPRYTFARNIVLATGMLGCPVVPRGLVHCPKTVFWNDPGAMPTPKCLDKKPQQVLVVGGGLTAVQAALRVVQDGHKCVLCSRRPLQEKHFDIPVEWFDRRKTNLHLSGLYHSEIESRLQLLKETRDGGSVPSVYMQQIRENKKNLICCFGDVKYVDDDEVNKTSDDCVTVVVDGVYHKFHKIILACGVAPDFSSHPVIAKLLSKWPISTHGGLPDLTQDLQWNTSNRANVFVVGAMAALQVGPDAGNLMGMRRAARVVASALDCRGWLRERVLANPFMALWSSDSDDDDSSKESTNLMKLINDNESPRIAIVDDSGDEVSCASKCQSDETLHDSRHDCSTCDDDNDVSSLDSIDN